MASGGISSSDAQRWVSDAGGAGLVLFVLTAAMLGLALFAGHVTATVAGVLFGAVAGVALALAASLPGGAFCTLAARALGTEAVTALLDPRGRHWRDWMAANGSGPSSRLVSRQARRPG